MGVHYEKRKSCGGFFHWLLEGYWSVNKWGEREWGLRIFGIVIDNELKGGTV